MYLMKRMIAIALLNDNGQVNIATWIIRLGNPLAENKLWSIAKPYYFIFLKKGLQTSVCISICRTAKLIVGGGTPPTAHRPGWCPHQPATN